MCTCFFELTGFSFVLTFWGQQQLTNPHSSCGGWGAGWGSSKPFRGAWLGKNLRREFRERCSKGSSEARSPPGHRNNKHQGERYWNSMDQPEGLGSALGVQRFVAPAGRIKLWREALVSTGVAPILAQLSNFESTFFPFLERSFGGNRFRRCGCILHSWRWRQNPEKGRADGNCHAVSTWIWIWPKTSEEGSWWELQTSSQLCGQLLDDQICHFSYSQDLLWTWQCRTFPWSHGVYSSWVAGIAFGRHLWPQVGENAPSCAFGSERRLAVLTKVRPTGPSF